MKDGGPAFPIKFRYERSDGAIVTHDSDGMTLRDYFAAQALSGRCARPEVACDGWPNTETNNWAIRVANECYAYADAMLAEREKLP